MTQEPLEPISFDSNTNRWESIANRFNRFTEKIRFVHDSDIAIECTNADQQIKFRSNSYDAQTDCLGRQLFKHNNQSGQRFSYPKCGLCFL